MSILDQIYKNSQTVSAELKGMNASLKTMRDKDKQEYTLDNKQRKYERERDKRESQDRRKVFDKLNKSQSDSVAKVKGQNAQKSIQAGLAQTIAKSMKDLKGKGVKVPKGTGVGGPSGTTGIRMSAPKQTITQKPDTELQERVGRLEAIISDSLPPERRGFQAGGFTGMVPNVGQPTTGDHYYTNVEPGSYILNRNAVQNLSGFQSGGTVPVALEKGEIAMPPGSYDQKIMDYLNYEAFPRFQKGGDVPKRPGNGAPSEDSVKPQGKLDLKNAKGFQKGGKIFLHWAGSGYSGAHPNYHATVQGSGKVIKTRDYDTFGGGHTAYRNNTGIGLSLAAMSDATDRNFGTHPVKGVQYQGMAKLTAKIAKSWGWKSGDINIQNVMTHAEAGSGKDGILPRGDNYGPQAWGGDGARWDLWKLYEKDPNGSGGEKIRNMIRREMGGNPTVEETSASPTQANQGDTPSDPQAPQGSRSGTPGGPNRTPDNEKEEGGGLFGGILGGFFKAINDKVFGGENAKYGLNLGMLMGMGGGGGGGGGMPSIDDMLSSMFGGGGGPDTMGPAGGDNDNPLPAPTPGETQQQPERERKGQGNRTVSTNTNRGGGITNNQRALLNAIADAEGTNQYPNKGYNTHFGGGQTKDLSKHPRRKVSKGGYHSDAFGRYQFLSTTWAGLGLKGMSPANQDKGALKLVTGRGVDLSDGLSIKEIYRLGGEWASIEGGREMKAGGSYGSQAKYSARQFMKMYQKYGGKRQGMQTGGMVGALGRAVAPSVMHFFEQNATENARMVEGEQPQVINMGGDGGGQEPHTVYHTRGTNQPTYNLASRDSCPLSMYYRFHPSFNPQGMNP